MNATDAMTLPRQPEQTGRPCEQAVEIACRHLDAAIGNPKNPWYVRVLPKQPIVRPHAQAGATKGFCHGQLATADRCNHDGWISEIDRFVAFVGRHLPELAGVSRRGIDDEAGQLQRKLDA